MYNYTVSDAYVSPMALHILGISSAIYKKLVKALFNVNITNH